MHSLFYPNKTYPLNTYPFFIKDSICTEASFRRAFRKYEICTFNARELVCDATPHTCSKIISLLIAVLSCLTNRRSISA